MIHDPSDVGVPGAWGAAEYAGMINNRFKGGLLTARRCGGGGGRRPGAGDRSTANGMDDER